jgi:hypothetical protein
MTAGKKTLNGAAGERHLASESSGTEMVAMVLNGYVATMQRGDDFIIHHLTQVDALGH